MVLVNSGYGKKSKPRPFQNQNFFDGKGLLCIFLKAFIKMIKNGHYKFRLRVGFLKVKTIQPGKKSPFKSLCN